MLGAVATLAIALAWSSDRRAISRRAVLAGVALQWVVALILLRVPVGRDALEWIAAGVTQILEHSFAGSEFVFGPLGASGSGDTGLGPLFAFQVLPTIIYIASLFALLYHLGVMQWIVRGLARVMRRAMGTSGRESLAVAASIFMGQTEAPLTIRPYLARLSESELFLVMVAGMASVSGAILGAYVQIGGVPMDTLLVAVAMTAPASVVMAKIMVPEPDAESSNPDEAAEVIDLQDDRQANVLAAVVQGATDGLKLAVNVGAMLIAFIALVALFNAVVGMVYVGGDPLSLERVLGWVFQPLAWMMGVPAAETQTVGSILGIRTVLNELLAFEALAHADLAGLSTRASAITTVAICGFANISSIGIQIGGLGALVPERRDDIARLGVRALAAATLANFSSACVTGTLLP
jgi:CNT family concentrative nucleoside transporter